LLVERFTVSPYERNTEFAERKNQLVIIIG